MKWKLTFNKRIWTRDLNDLYGGPMSSMHAFIKAKLPEGQVRGVLALRDCDNQISFEHWVENNPRHVKTALKNLKKIRKMLDDYIQAFEDTCDRLTFEGPPTKPEKSDNPLLTSVRD